MDSSQTVLLKRDTTCVSPPHKYFKSNTIESEQEISDLVPAKCNKVSDSSLMDTITIVNEQQESNNLTHEFMEFSSKGEQTQSNVRTTICSIPKPNSPPDVFPKINLEISNSLESNYTLLSL